MITALLYKELQQHGAAFAAALTLVAAILACLWFTALWEDEVTLLQAAHTLVAYVVPALVLFVDGRLVVHDHDEGTHEFLAALPIDPVVRTLVRFGVGLAVIESTVVAVLLSTALLASRREGVPAGWLLELGAQLGLYAAAWHGVAFGIAHLGNVRWLAWWTLLVSGSVAGTLVASPSASVYWFGLVRLGADRTRLAPPWDAVPLALAWTVVGTALAVGLASWRGGTLLERAFRPITADVRARQIGFGVALLLAGSVFEEQAPREDTWVSLPAVPSARATIRVAASEGDPLWAVGTGAAAALDALGAEIGVDRWPPVVLLRSRAEPGRRAVRVAPDDENERARVLLVDPDRPVDDLVRRVVAEVLVHRLAGLARWDADARWIADAAGPWWLGTDRALLQQRAALGQGTAALAVEDWYAVVAAVGPDVASGVGWAGLVALEGELGRDVVLDRLRAVLSPERAERWPDGLGLRRTTRSGWTGLDPARLAALWEAELGRVPPPSVPGLPSVRLANEDGAVVARWEGAVPDGAVLETAVVDGLQDGWLPDDPTELDPLPADTTEMQLRLDPRSRVLGRIVADTPYGQRATGWSEAR